MIIFEQKDSPFLHSTFMKKELEDSFKEKWKKIFQSLTLDVRSGNNTTTYDLFEDQLGKLVRDFSEDRLVLSGTFVKPSVEFAFYTSANQPIAQCSTIIVQSRSRPNEVLQDLYNDLFYLMGYTCILITTAKAGWYSEEANKNMDKGFSKLNYLPVATFKNRRTGSQINVMLKQTQLCL